MLVEIKKLASQNIGKEDFENLIIESRVYKNEIIELINAIKDGEDKNQLFEKVKEVCENENLAEVVIGIVVNDIKPFEDTKFLRDLDEGNFEFLISYMFDNTIIQEELKKIIRESTGLKDKEIECIERLLNTLLNWIISKRLSKAYCFHNLSELFRFDNVKSNFIWELFNSRKQELIAVVLLENIALCRDIKETVDGWTELFSDAFNDNQKLDEDIETQ